MKSRRWFKPRSADEPVDIVGAKNIWVNDLYHSLLRSPWWVVVAAVVVVFLVVNVGFSFLYLLSGGVAHVRPGSLTDLFFFSVQTMATIGYGAMYPETLPAHLIVTAQALSGIIFTAVVTGVVFSKFSVPQSRVRFATKMVVSPMDTVPTLMLRVGNERSNQIVEATVRITLVRTEHTQEGTLMYRLYDLPLARHRQPAFSRSWIIMHPLNLDSPLQGLTPKDLQKAEVEFLVTITGIDETSSQTLHARHRYDANDVEWGARYADMISEQPNGRLQLNMLEFDRIESTKPSEKFPYPAIGNEGGRE